MKGDKYKIYHGNASEMLAGARKLALNMLRVETTRKVSVPRKQKRAHESTDYLNKVLAVISNERNLNVHAQALG